MGLGIEIPVLGWEQQTGVMSRLSNPLQSLGNFYESSTSLARFNLAPNSSDRAYFLAERKLDFGLLGYACSLHIGHDG